jgi:hypothetical protein
MYTHICIEQMYTETPDILRVMDNLWVVTRSGPLASI